MVALEGMATFPEVGEIVEDRIFSIVDLPAPFLPTKPILSFTLTTRFTSLRSVLSPYFTSILEAVIILVIFLRAQIYNLMQNKSPISI